MATRSAGKDVIFEPMGLFARASENATLLNLARQAGLELRADCGGKARCGKCRVKAVPPENLSLPTDSELRLITPEDLAAGQRLACQTRALGPVTVTVAEASLETGEALGKTGLAGQFPVDPSIRRAVVPAQTVAGDTRHGHTDLSGWLVERTEAAIGRKVELGDTRALREMARPVLDRKPVTLVERVGRGVVSVMAGERSRSLGLAVDVGTTTVAAYLCDLVTGKVLISKGAANPQRRYGEDVISRISLADMETDGLERLNSAVVKVLDELAGECLKEVDGLRDDIDEMVIVGNTTMEELVAGYHPHGLGVNPYLPVDRTMGDFSAAELGLDLKPGTNVNLFPVIHGYVGGDTVGAILSAGPHRSDEICLIVDIGTNGELVLGNRKGLYSTSCATGPALEGAHISCGMRAAAGAIHKVTNDPSTNQPVIEILGGDGHRPAGLCGSGIIDLVASLGRAGVIEPSGRFNNKAPGVNLDDNGLARSYTLVPPEHSATENGVLLQLSDIRQVQLAKAALAVGIEHLLKAAGVDKVDRLVLTGAFGARFDWRSGVDIGLLPQAAVAGRVETVENGAGLGAIMALLDAGRRTEADRVARETEYVDLASQQGFNDDFTAGLGFPF